MGTKNQYQGIEEYAVRLIRHKAHQLTGQSGFSDLDREDVEQELMMDLLNRLPNYDPEIAERNTFITRIVNNRVATIIEERTAWRRDYRLNEFSLNENCFDLGPEKPVQRQEQVSEDEYILRTGKANLIPNEERDLVIDVNRALEILPPDFRDLCERLKSRTVTEVSRETGMPRSTIYESIRKVRELFREAGLTDYL